MPSFLPARKVYSQIADLQTLNNVVAMNKINNNLNIFVHKLVGDLCVFQTHLKFWPLGCTFVVCENTFFLANVTISPHH